MGISGKRTVCLVAALTAFFLLVGSGGVTRAWAGQDGMNILTKGLQILRKQMLEEPAKDGASDDMTSGKAVFNNSSASREVQVGLGQGLKAFVSLGAPPPDFDGRNSRNYGASIGINIAY